MSTHYIYEGKEYATLAEVRRAVNKSFPKNPDTAMLLLLNIKTVERPDPVPQEPTEEEKAAAALEQAKQERASTVEKIKGSSCIVVGKKIKQLHRKAVV